MGKYIAVALMYRGRVQPADVTAALARARSGSDSSRVGRMQFVDWIPGGGFKVRWRT